MYSVRALWKSLSATLTAASSADNCCFLISMLLVYFSTMDRRLVTSVKALRMTRW